jgi:outer membrane protein assembly factor BamB
MPLRPVFVPTLVLTLLVVLSGSVRAVTDEATPPPDADTTPESAMFRGNAGRTGEQPGPGPAGTPTRRWRFQPGADGFFDPVVAGGTLYVVGSVAADPDADDGTSALFLFAVDAATGQERWRFRTGSGTRSAPAVVDGVVYVGGDSMLSALDASTGQERWRAAIQGTAGSPAATDGVVYVATLADHLYAIDAATGRWHWRKEIGGLHGDPAVADGGVYVAAVARGGSNSHHDFVIAVSTAAGDERWREEIVGGAESPPAVSDGAVYVAQRYGGVVALDAATGAARWNFLPGPDAHFVMTNVAVAHGTLYARSFERVLYAIDATTGQERWHAAVDGVVAPVVADGVVYAGGRGALAAFDASFGAERWRRGLDGGPAGSPAVAAGLVYVSVGATAQGAADSAVVAIG